MSGASTPEDDHGVLAAPLHEGVQVLDVDPVFGQHLENAVEPPRPVRDLDGHDDGPAGPEALLLEDLACAIDVVDDQAEDAEVGGVRQATGS